MSTYEVPDGQIVNLPCGLPSLYPLLNTWQRNGVAFLALSYEDWRQVQAWSLEFPWMLFSMVIVPKYVLPPPQV
jgi:hypothetical protein